MRNARPERRIWETALGVLVLMLGLSALAEGELPALFLLMLGGYFLWRQFDSGRVNTTMPSTRYDDWDDSGQTARQSGAEQVYAHALRAAERAGLEVDQAPVLPVDIGLMIFRGDQDPVVYRTRPIPDDVDYIQPFVQLRLPSKANGRIRFELVDADGQKLFIHEDRYQLERGRNLISPAARLPIHDSHAMQRDWHLRIFAGDGTPLATHTFAWQESEAARVRRHITEDGEISGEMRAMMAENRLGKMSLDELLSYQEDDGGAEEQARRAAK